MANYIESFKSKMDWGNTFVRTGAFPLDRSSMFSSYDDAVLYAAGTGADSRGLGKTSYVGQLITVYQDSEVKVYVIKEDRTLEAVGAGSGSLAIDKFTIVDGKVAEATEKNVGQVIYITEGEGDYGAGAYIVTGVGTVASLSTTTAGDDLGSAVTVLQGQVGNISSTLSGVSDRVDALEGDNTSNKNEITNIKNDAATLSGRVDTLGTNLETLSTRVDGLVTDVTVNGSSVVDGGVAKVPGYVFEKLETAETGAASTYAFYKVNNGTKTELGRINIPLDQVLRDSKLETVTVAGEPYADAVVGDLYFVFEFQNNPDKIYVPAKKLTDVYVGDSVYINVTGNTVSLDIDAVKTAVKNDIASVMATKSDVATAKQEAIDAAQSYTNGALQGYVVKDGDKVLSDNNFSDEDVAKLAGIAEGAEVNTIVGVSVNGTAVTPVDRVVNISYADVLSETEENAIKAKAVWARFNIVDAALAERMQISFVDELPASSDASKNVIYIVTKTNGDGSTYLEQNIYYMNGWVVIGSTNYATKALASSTNDGLMSSMHYNKLENLIPISEDELRDIISGGTVTE